MKNSLNSYLNFLVLVMLVPITSCQEAGENGPGTSINISLNRIQKLQAEAPETFNEFGYSICFRGDSNILAVGEKKGDPGITTSAGHVYIFDRNVNNTWQYAQTLVSHNPESLNYFGHDVSFSPDGILAVSELAGSLSVAPYGGGTVQLFVKGAVWDWTRSLPLNPRDVINRFGQSIDFSVDGSLAIGETSADPVVNNVVISHAGAVNLYSSGNSYNGSVGLLISPTPEGLMKYGDYVKYSPDGNFLLVAETAAQSLYVYKKNNGSWDLFDGFNLDSDLAVTADFSPDSKLLAIGERGASPDGITHAGGVYLYELLNNVWQPIDLLTAATLETEAKFGSDVNFSPDGNFLAVGAIAGGAESQGGVRIFKKGANGWEYGPILRSDAPRTDNEFGGRVLFSPDGSLLAVTELFGDPTTQGQANAGIVHIYEVSIQ